MFEEVEARRLLDAIAIAQTPITSGIVRLETSMVVGRRNDIPPNLVMLAFDELLENARIQTRPLTDEISRQAVVGFERYGKGRGHPAQLNLADCLSYACAKSLNVPILFKGNDFNQTDLEIARY